MAAEQHTRADRRVRLFLDRARVALRPPAVPDYPEPVRTGPPEPPRTAWLRQLDRTRHTLELGRAAIQRDGWTSGGWFSVATRGDQVRVVDGARAGGLLRPDQDVVGACAVGALLRLAEDPDRPTTVADVRRSVDELHEAIQEADGLRSRPAGQAYALATRRAHLRTVTAWNDAPGRTRDDVLDLFERAIGRTIIGSCRA